MSESGEDTFFKSTKPGKGLLIVVSGPSGSGKGTVLSEVFAANKNIFYSVSATTRAPRPGEVDGRHYYFLSKEEFKKRIDSGGMLEYACYCGNYYGTPRSAVEKQRNAGNDVVLEIDIQGAIQVKKACPDCVTIFIAPPSAEELERRLRGRGTESDEVIKKRLETAVKEISKAEFYDYIVVNDEVETAAKKIGCIITAEKCKSTRINR
jgi:guanylate kinase